MSTEQTRAIPLSQLRDWVDTMKNIYDKLAQCETADDNCKQADIIWALAEAIDDEYIEGFDVTK